MKQLLAMVGIMRFQMIRESMWSFTMKAFSAGIGFLSTIIMARFLGAEGYGIYAYAYSLVTLLALPSHAGLPNLVMRETAKGMAQERPGHVKGAWQWSGKVVAIISIIIMVFIGPLFVVWQGGFESTSGQTMAWALGLVPLMALGNLRGAALRGLQKVVMGQLPEFVLRPGLFLLLLVGSLFLCERMLSSQFAMVLHITASFIAFLVGAWLLWLHTPEKIYHSQPALDSRGWLTSSMLFALLAGFGVVNNQASTVILGLFAVPEAVGRFRVAVQVSTLAAFGLQAISVVVAPRFASLWANGDKVRLQWLVTRSAQGMLAFNLFVTTIFILAGRPLFQLMFGTEFDDSYIPLLILLLGHIVDSAMGPAGLLLNMTGHEKETSLVMAFAAGLNIMLNVLLVRTWGIIGTAIATSISMATWKVLFWWRARKCLGLNSWALSIVKLRQ